MRTVAFDGLNSIKVPDTDRNRGWLGRIRYQFAFAGYPAVWVMCLVETGTRGLLGAVIGGAIGRAGDRDETHLAPAADAAAGAGDAAARRPGLRLGRVPRRSRQGGSGRKPPVLRHLPDGPYLSDVAGLAVRIIEADLTMHGRDGTTVSDTYRLITTLLDERRFPAAVLIRLYHERWEIESAFLALRHTLLGGHVLRSGDRAGVEQELWALLTLYQLLRIAMVEAIETCPGLDPDRASFTTALQTARDQLVTAAGIHPDTTASRVQLGVIGAAALATLLPARRAPYSNGNVKCPEEEGWGVVDSPAVPGGCWTRSALLPCPGRWIEARFHYRLARLSTCRLRPELNAVYPLSPVCFMKRCIRVVNAPVNSSWLVRWVVPPGLATRMKECLP